MIDMETFDNGFFLVVVALNQVFASDIVLAFNFRRIELHVIGPP